MTAWQYKTDRQYMTAGNKRTTGLLMTAGEQDTAGQAIPAKHTDKYNLFHSRARQIINKGQ